MSDLTIPGVTSSIDTKSMIEALMEPERAKLARKEEEVQSLKNQKEVWQDIRTDMTRLQEASKKLYGFQNPFDEKVAQSSISSALTATATREANLEEKEIIIKQIAAADRFMSGSLSKDFRAPAGTYRFTIGEEEVQFNFRGGTLRDLADSINRTARLKANVINDTSTTQVITVESTQPGAENKLTFYDTALDFGLESGMLRSTNQTQLNIALDSSSIGRLAQGDSISIADGILELGPAAGEVTIPITPPFTLNPDMVLEMDVENILLAEEPWEELSAPPGPDIPPPGSSQYGGITIRNEKSRAILPKWTPPSPPERIDDPKVASIRSSGRTIDIVEVGQTSDSQKIQIKVGELADSLDAILLRNRNTHQRIRFSNIRIYDRTVRGDYRPTRPLSEAQDAVIRMDGIEIKRNSNDIDDLIPGVNLTLQEASDKPITLSIQKDIENIKSDLIEFIGYYNRLLTQIDILSRNDPSVIEEALYLDEEEKEKAEKNLGLLQGDLNLSRLKSKLRNIMLSPYRTSEGSNLTLLAQIGISTDSATPGTRSSLDKTKLRGYIEIDESKLEEALARYPESIKELFGNDTDGDFIVDSGVAFSIDSNVKQYVSAGGIIATKVATLDQTVQRRNNDIADFNKHLETYEAELRKKYGMMEGMLQEMERNSKSIENFNRGPE